MLDDAEPLVLARLAAQRGRLLEWLVNSAYPRWAAHGISSETGGFVEALGADGEALPLPCRGRVPPRQLYAFAQAPSLGWQGDSLSIVRRGLDWLLARFRRADGFYRALVAADGKPLDDTALLYDQAFVLLGLAAAAERLDRRGELERLALNLRAQIEARWRIGVGEFLSGEGSPALRECNPHMHLLEACLAWSSVGADPDWGAWVDELADAALHRFIDPSTGALYEAYTADWQPIATPPGMTVEPGHQYEWAWLLLRCGRRDRAARYAAALRLIEIAETHGVRRGHAVNSLGADLTVRDGRARLWPQTERIKATRLAAELSGDLRYASMAAEACASLFGYLGTPTPGLWFDLRATDGVIVDGPAPASTFYHLIGAIQAMGTSPCPGAGRKS